MLVCVPKIYRDVVGLFDLAELDGMQVTLRVMDGYLMGTTEKGQLVVLSAPADAVAKFQAAEDGQPGEEIPPNPHGHTNGHSDLNGLNGKPS